MNDIYRSFYTKSQVITDYMIQQLDVQKNDKILEPSAGDGIFIEELLKLDYQGVIDAYDIDPSAISMLEKKFSDRQNIKVFSEDTLTSIKLDMHVLAGGYYDKIIGNPPYGGWQDHEKRALLKKQFVGFYVKETYALFLARCVSLLKENGVLTFIIPDTFMNIHRHTKLREFLLLNTKIKRITMFPSHFFPGVQFKYSNMCIVTLEKKTDEALSNEIEIVTGFKKIEELKRYTEGQCCGDIIIHHLNQEEVFKSKDQAFLIKAGKGIRSLINTSKRTLDEVADCVTGIYTGDNKRFYKVASGEVKFNTSKCSIVHKEEIRQDYLSVENLITGLDGDPNFIPVAKGSSGPYIRRNDWYIDWSKAAVNYYNTDKKARFQNSGYYFKAGIALPMVKSSKIRANLLENQVFDQSIVGIFPKNNEHLLYLLAFFNTDVFNRIIHTINPTANNSANYVKKIPIIIPEDFSDVDSIVEEIIQSLKAKNTFDAQLQEKLDDYFNDIYKEWI
ncbi:Eco57I restriction-modification methylase domain-containing protein [Paenibacillus sp. T2-29]|uniref:Eco57I restriction-modification methylase domain-containing protein n=1 Tax=Paenibacillus TaxID=44249 RepID=UPI00046FDC66|nr:Eco57I restriction-modification methylase domain-containing protein [Paenibacillus polymyxa]